MNSTIKQGIATIDMSLAHFGTKININGRDLNIQTDIDPLTDSDAVGEGRLKT